MSNLDWFRFRWKFLISLLFVFVKPHESNASGLNNKPSMVQSCSKVTQFASSISAFTYCSLTTNEKNLCRKCHDEMTGIYDNYLSINTMIPEPTLSGKSACPEDIVTPKKLSDIHFYFKQTESIWLTGNCDTCYEIETPNDESSSVGRKRNLQVFDDLVIKFAACVDLHPNNTCEDCDSPYTELNDFYDQLSSKFDGNLCFEISITMADARSRWSTDFHCHIQIGNDYIIIIIASTVILVSILVYFIGRGFMQVLRPSIMIPKRQSSVNFRSLEEVTERTPIIS